MDDQAINSLLKSNPIFSCLSDRQRKNLIPLFKVVELSENKILFYQGDIPNDIYLLASGKLAAEIITSTGKTEIVGRIEAGEVVGEMGVLTNEPRSLTIKALTDSTLLKLSAHYFLELARQHSGILSAIITPLISRSTGLIKYISMSKKEKHIVIVPANRNTTLENFEEELRNVAGKFPKTLIISNYHDDFHDKNTSHEDVRNKVKALKKSVPHLSRVCYILSSHDTFLARTVLNKNAKIYIVANAKEAVNIDQQLLHLLTEKNQDNLNLILLYPPNTVPQNTIEWLKLAKFALYHHIRMGNAKDFQRLFRFIRGKAVGLVLSGGGTRGWAHLGAIKAIREAKIPIDIIGGTSVGAMVAGLYAMHQSYEQAYESFKQIVIDSKHSVSWRSITWPIISIFNAKNITNSQINAFQDARIEDLWLPFFCVTSNISQNKEELLQAGLIWEVVRASISIPGLMPPMLLNDELHVDGGLLNNLPVDIMRRLIGPKGNVIAIQLNNVSKDNHQYQFPPMITFTDAIRNKFSNRYKFPPFLDTFLRSMFLNSELRDNANALIANTYVSLDLHQFRVLYSDLEEGEKLIEIGYNETKRRLG